MIISANTMALIVTIALAITIIAPIALLIIWIKDWKGGKLW